MHVAIPDIEPHLAHAPAGESVPFDASDAIWSLRCVLVLMGVLCCAQDQQDQKENISENAFEAEQAYKLGRMYYEMAKYMRRKAAEQEHPGV